MNATKAAAVIALVAALIIAVYFTAISYQDFVSPNSLRLDCRQGPNCIETHEFDDVAWGKYYVSAGLGVAFLITSLALFGAAKNQGGR